MKKKGLMITFGTILIVTAALLVFGVLHNKNIESQPSFTGEYDVHENQILFVMAMKEKETLYLKSEDNQAEKLYEVDENLKIESPIFTDEGEVSFVLTTGAPDAPPGKQEFQLVQSDVINYHLEHDKTTTILDARGYITDLLYDEANARILLSAVHMSTDNEPKEGFISYASALYTLNKEEALEKIRDIDAYSPDSLQITENGKNLLMILPDDFENVSTDSMFEATERIFEMEIEHPDDMKIISKKNSEVPISEFVLMKDENKILCQTIMNYKEGGTFLYDHIWYDISGREEGNRLHINDAVQHTKLKEKENWLYYSKINKKVDQTQVYNLFRYDLRGDKGEEKISLKKLLIDT